MKILNMLAITGAVLSAISVTEAGEQKGLMMIKTIPQAATLEYRVEGKIMQSIDISPGVYQISVKQLR